MVLHLSAVSRWGLWRRRFGGVFIFSGFVSRRSVWPAVYLIRIQKPTRLSLSHTLHRSSQLDAGSETASTKCPKLFIFSCETSKCPRLVPRYRAQLKADAAAEATGMVESRRTESYLAEVCNKKKKKWCHCYGMFGQPKCNLRWAFSRTSFWCYFYFSMLLHLATVLLYMV